MPLHLRKNFTSCSFMNIWRKINSIDRHYDSVVRLNTILSETFHTANTVALCNKSQKNWPRESRLQNLWLSSSEFCKITKRLTNIEKTVKMFSCFSSYTCKYYLSLVKLPNFINLFRSVRPRWFLREVQGYSSIQQTVIWDKLGGERM